MCLLRCCLTGRHVKNHRVGSRQQPDLSRLVSLASAVDHASTLGLRDPPSVDTGSVDSS